METPPICITTQDLKRLELHLSSSAVRALPGSSMLQQELERADVVEPDEIVSDTVTMNSTVKFVDEQTGTTHELTLVYPDHAGVPGTVSVFAPAGSALLGLTVGQSIKWQVPGRRQLQLRVVTVTGKPQSRKKSAAHLRPGSAILNGQAGRG